LAAAGTGQEREQGAEHRSVLHENPRLRMQKPHARSSLAKASFAGPTDQPDLAPPTYLTHLAHLTYLAT